MKSLVVVLVAVLAVGVAPSAAHAGVRVPARVGCETILTFTRVGIDADGPFVDTAYTKRCGRMECTSYYTTRDGVTRLVSYWCVRAGGGRSRR